MTVDGSHRELARQLGATVIARNRCRWLARQTWPVTRRRSCNRRLLLFLDADTWFEPDGLARVLSGYSGGAFSPAYHAVRKPYEDLSLFFNVT